MYMIKRIITGWLILCLLVFSSCGAYFNQPLNTLPARIGESTFESRLKDVSPVKPIEAAVYKFRDQTGQYKLVEGGISYSTAVTQGATSILIKALEDSKWFVPIERENVSNLLNERQIIRSTRDEFNRKNNIPANQQTDLPPLLFAGVLFEGGIISYDSNMITGGAGARYFGAGASTQYRQDVISIYLRAVSTSNGKVLKTVYITKTILSQALDVSLFRYVNVKRLLEVETGVTQNEPAQMAVKEAIEKAVENIIIEGVIDGLWQPEGGPLVAQRLKEEYEKEEKHAESTRILNRTFQNYRGSSGFNFASGGAMMDGDYPGATIGYNHRAEIKAFLTPKMNVGVSGGLFKLKNEDVFKKTFYSIDANFEYILLPFEKITPIVYGGGGFMMSKTFKPEPKLQYGLGLEYMISKKLGFRVFGEQNIMTNDKLDDLVQGKRDDYFWRFGVSLNFYLGQPFDKAKSKY